MEDHSDSRHVKTATKNPLQKEDFQRVTESWYDVGEIEDRALHCRCTKVVRVMSQRTVHRLEH